MTRNNSVGLNPITRRAILRSTTIGLAGTAILGTTTGRRPTRYIIAGDNHRSSVETLPERVARAGFDVKREIAGGAVLIAEGYAGRRARLVNVAGVRHAVEDIPVQFDRPALRPATTDKRSDSLLEADEDDEYVTRQWDKEIMGVFEAHETATGDGVRVGVIDTGIDATHPDLKGNVDLEASRYFEGGEVLPAEGVDPTGHGTIVAGHIAASNDGTRGMVGVAPDAELVALTPVGSAESFLQDVLLAISYAAEIELDILNLSLGIPFDFSTEVRQLVRFAASRIVDTAFPQMVGVVASGNDGSDINQAGRFEFPGSLLSMTTVGATGPNDRRAWYSTYGEGYIDVVAPGGGYETPAKNFCADDRNSDERGRVSADIKRQTPPSTADQFDPGQSCDLPAYPYPTNRLFSTVPPKSIFGRGFGYSDPYYAYIDGTSFCAPQVTGIVALVREIAPDIPAADVQQLIKETAEPILGESRAEIGAGRVNAARAVKTAQERTRR